MAWHCKNTGGYVKESTEAYDNAVMESFFGRLKNELYYGHEDSYSSFQPFF